MDIPPNMHACISPSIDQPHTYTGLLYLVDVPRHVSVQDERHEEGLHLQH